MFRCARIYEIVNSNWKWLTDDWYCFDNVNVIKTLLARGKYIYDIIHSFINYENKECFDYVFNQISNHKNQRAIVSGNNVIKTARITDDINSLILSYFVTYECTEFYKNGIIFSKDEAAARQMRYDILSCDLYRDIKDIVDNNGNLSKKDIHLLYDNLICVIKNNMYEPGIYTNYNKMPWVVLTQSDIMYIPLYKDINGINRHYSFIDNIQDIDDLYVMKIIPSKKVNEFYRDCYKLNLGINDELGNSHDIYIRLKEFMKEGIGPFCVKMFKDYLPSNIYDLYTDNTSLSLGKETAIRYLAEVFNYIDTCKMFTREGIKDDRYRLHEDGSIAFKYSISDITKVPEPFEDDEKSAYASDGNTFIIFDNGSVISDNCDKELKSLLIGECELI